MIMGCRGHCHHVIKNLSKTVRLLKEKKIHGIEVRRFSSNSIERLTNKTLSLTLDKCYVNQYSTECYP